jgi:hypothetical protein
MLPFHWRMVGYGLAVAAILGAGWWVNGRLERAKEADRLETEIASLRAGIARAAEQAAKAAKDQAESAAREAALAARIAGLPKERLIYVPKPVPGQPVPAGACARLSDDFLRAYNEAVAGPAR